MSMWWVAGFVSLALLAFAIITFNDLFVARNRVRAAWSNIDVQLQRRYDLVPGLVAVVKGYAAHERAMFEEVAQLRNLAGATAPIAKRGKIESQLQAQVERLLALQENYPDLKASDNFMQLQRDLVDVEDRLQTARQEYNETVRSSTRRSRISRTCCWRGRSVFAHSNSFRQKIAKRCRYSATTSPLLLLKFATHQRFHKWFVEQHQIVHDGALLSSRRQPVAAK